MQNFFLACQSYYENPESPATVLVTSSDYRPRYRYIQQSAYEIMVGR